MNAFYKSLKAGDKVIFSSRFNTRVVTVARLTKTQIVLSTGTKFRISDGGEVGGHKFYSSSISEATDIKVYEFEVKAKRKAMIKVIDETVMSGLTNQQLVKIYRIIQEK
jgi:hypothetical protein